MRFEFGAMSALVLSCAALSACSGNSDAVDNTALEPTRETRIDSLVTDVCGKYKDCEGYSSGNRYASAADCDADIRQKITSLWPQDKCGNDQITNEFYLACQKKAEIYICDADIGNTVSAWAECSASNVCQDPAK